jgi:hypothetical protein
LWLVDWPVYPRMAHISDGNRWTTSRWRDIDITTVERPER